MTAATLSLAAAIAAAVPTGGSSGKWNRAVVELTDIDSLSLSPDGRLLLFRTSRPDVDHNWTELAWFSLDTLSGNVGPIGPGGEAIFDDPGLLRSEPPIWLDDGETAMVRQRQVGATGLWAFRRSTRSLLPAVVGEADIETPRLSEDGRSILYEVGPSRDEIRKAEEAERDNGVEITPKVDLAQNLFRGGSVEGRKASQRLTGFWYMRGGLLANSPRQTRRWRAADGQDEPIGKPTPRPAFVPPPIASVASVAAADGARADAFWDGFAGRVEWRDAGGSTMTCGDPICWEKRVASFAWRSPARELLVTFSDRHLRQTLALWDLSRNRISKVKAGNGLLSGGTQGSTPCAVNAEAAFCVSAEPAGPPRLVRIDLANGKTAMLFDPNAVLRQAYRPKVEPLSLTLNDGTPVAGLLLSGPSSSPGRAPLFVNYYRCEGFLRGGEGDEWPIAALIDAGFLVACLNTAPFRGPQHAVRTYENGLAAVRNLVGQLAAAGRIDPAQVAMGGFSFGSEVAMWTAMKSDLLAAVSIASAQPEPADYWYGAILGPAHDKMVRDVWGLGSPDETPGQWRLVSPALNADGIRAPVLLQLPEQEARRIPELFARLRAAGTPVQFWAYPDEAHIKVEPRHRLSVFERNFDWFTYWLLGRRDPDPGKARQYEAWDGMRARRSTGAGPSPTP